MTSTYVKRSGGGRDDERFKMQILLVSYSFAQCFLHDLDVVAFGSDRPVCVICEV